MKILSWRPANYYAGLVMLMCISALNVLVCASCVGSTVVIPTRLAGMQVIPLGSEVMGLSGQVLWRSDNSLLCSTTDSQGNFRLATIDVLTEKMRIVSKRNRLLNLLFQKRSGSNLDYWMAVSSDGVRLLVTGYVSSTASGIKTQYPGSRFLIRVNGESIRRVTPGKGLNSRDQYLALATWEGDSRHWIECSGNGRCAVHDVASSSVVAFTPSGEHWVRWIGMPAYDYNWPDDTLERTAGGLMELPSSRQYSQTQSSVQMYWLNVSEHKIILTDLSKPRNLAADDVIAIVSPDRMRVAWVTHNSTYRYDVYVSALGSQRAQLIANCGNIYDFGWSPDSKRIAVLCDLPNSQHFHPQFIVATP